MSSRLVHHHTIVVAAVESPVREEGRARSFLSSLVDKVKMKKMYGPVVEYGPNGLSGFVIITTSHMSFHFYPENSTLHLDVYSCRPYGVAELLSEIDSWWKIREADVLRIIRDEGPVVERFHYRGGVLCAGPPPVGQFVVI